MDSWNTYPKETSGGSKVGESSSSFLDLPEDAIANILRRLGACEILKNAQRVCSLWRRICKDSSMYHSIDMRCLDNYKSLDAMCRQAVDRSQGQLIELHVDHFNIQNMTHLLDYVSERSSKVRCLGIWSCYVVDDGLIEATKKFPLLEELHFFAVKSLEGSIEPIGRCCSMLKSFTLNSLGHRYTMLLRDPDDDDCDCDDHFVALPIAKSMPGLRHLRLVGSNVTSMGLEAIVDGCPNLESLDIRDCFDVFHGGEIGYRNAQRIRDFKGPFCRLLL